MPAQLASMSIKVEIYDQTYTSPATSTRPTSRSWRKHVDATMREIARATGTVDSVKVAVLAALAIADELQTLRAKPGRTDREELRERAERCLKLVERALQQSA